MGLLRLEREERREERERNICEDLFGFFEGNFERFRTSGATEQDIFDELKEITLTFIELTGMPLRMKM